MNSNNEKNTPLHDTWLFQKIENPKHPFSDTPIEQKSLSNMREFEKLIQDLIDSGNRRSFELEKITGNMFSKNLSDSRFDGLASLWWIIVRGNRDQQSTSYRPAGNLPDLDFKFYG